EAEAIAAAEQLINSSRRLRGFETLLRDLGLEPHNHCLMPEEPNGVWIRLGTLRLTYWSGYTHDTWSLQTSRVGPICGEVWATETIGGANLDPHEITAAIGRYCCVRCTPYCEIHAPALSA